MADKGQIDFLTKSKDGWALLHIHAHPSAKKNAIAGVVGDRLKVKIAADPVGGAANAELIKFLAKLLSLKRRDVTIVVGETSKQKSIELRGLTPTEACKVLTTIVSALGT